MAQGATEVFEALAGYLRDKDIDLASGTWKCALLSDPITALVDSETAPALGSTNCNEVSAGGGYSAGGIALTMANTDTGGVVALKLNTGTHADGKISWTSGASSPTNIKSALVFDDAATTPVDAAAVFIDMTVDGGVTPISLVLANISITFGSGGNAGEIFKIAA